MKIHQLLSGVDIPLTNEEQHFLDKHGTEVKITSLDEHEQWVAQSMVRKGAYKISKDSNTLIKHLHETN